jgi:hypothetical protein
MNRALMANELLDLFSGCYVPKVDIFSVCGAVCDCQQFAIGRESNGESSMGDAANLLPRRRTPQAYPGPT